MFKIFIRFEYEIVSLSYFFANPLINGSKKYSIKESQHVLLSHLI